jgi:hypothetical protein
MLTLAVSAVLGSALPAAQAAASRQSWRIDQVVSSSSSDTAMQGVAASGANDAWASGTTTQALVIEHWTGARWKAQSVPPETGAPGAGSS